ncbi:reverse transcriptase domain-containing protein, partial [Tanacetum coccineum]
MDKTKEVLKSFNSYSMEHVRRDQNKKADALSKLASMTFSRLAKEVLVEVLPEKSIAQKEDRYKLKASFRKYTKALKECIRGHDQCMPDPFISTEEDQTRYDIHNFSMGMEPVLVGY